MDSTETPTNEPDDVESLASFSVRRESMVSSEENVLEVPSKESQDRHGDTNDSMISSTPLNHSFRGMVMDESRVDLHNDWSPVMQRLELLKSQLESNDEVIHEMERNLKTKTPINELEKSEDDVEYLKRKVGSLEEKVSKAETIIYNLEEEIEEKNKLIEARTMVISVLQKDVEAKRISTNSMFEKTQQEIQNMHENFMAFKENMAAENKKLLDQLDSSRQRYRKLDSKLKEAEKEKGALVQLNNDLNFQIENIMILNNELKMKVVEITENIDSPKEKIRALTEELDSVKEEFQKTVLNLELEIAHYKGECEKIKKSFQDNQAFLEEEVIQLKQENKDLASIISSFEVEISSLESGRVEKEATLLAHVEEKESLISKMKRTMEGFCSERDGLLNRLTQAERDLETKESSFDRISSEVVELRAALDALKACGSSEEISCSLNNEINILQDQLCQCKNELQQEKQKVQMLTETIDELEEKIQDSDLLLIEEKQNNINIKKELEHLKHQIDEKEELVARERGNAAQLQENFCSVLNEVEQFKQLLRESNNETCDTQMKLQSAEEDKARLETVIGNLLRDVLSLTAKSTATEINFEKENHLYSILQEKFSELSTMFTQNSEDLKDKENTINILKADLEKVKQHQDQEDKVSLRDMEAYIQQQDEMINELEKRIKTKAEEVCHLTASCEELSQRMTDYANYTASEIGNRDNLIQNLQSLLANRNDGVDPTVDVQTLQARVNYLEQTLAEANSSLESQISKLKMVESENESFKLKIIEMNATLSDLRQNISVNEQQAIEKARQFDHLTSQYNDLLAKYNDVSATAARAESEFLAEANSNLETQILKLNIIESENDSLKAQIAEMNASLSDLRQNISVNEQQAIEKARQYDQITTQYNDLLGKYNDVSAYAAQAESELSNKEYIIQNLEIQGNTTRSEDAQRLQEDLNQLSTSLEKNTALLKEKDDAYLKLLSENDFIKNQLAENQQTLESKIEFCNKLQAKIDELTIEKENLSKFEARCFELSSQLEQLQLSDSDKNSEVQEELKQATNMMAHLSEENERLVNQVIELKDRLESAKLVEMEKIALKDELYALKEELSTKSTLQIKVQDLEKSVKEKDILISELQIQKGGQSEDFTKNSSPGLSENGDVSGKLLPLAQEYLRINCQLMILKDLLEDLINCEVDVLSPDSELKSILESLESDLQESEAVLKTYETKLRRSPGFNTESLESSVSAMRSFVDQITKQISTCGEVLKDWVLVKTPPKKSTFSTETQTEFPMESKGTSRLTSENLDDWNWDVENNEESEIKFGDNLLFYGSAPGQNQAHFQEDPASLVSNLDESASVDPKQKHSIEIMHGSVPSTPLGYEAEASKSIENEFSKLQVSENQVAYSSENIDPPHDGTEIPEPYYFSPEEQRVAYDELKKSLVPGFNRNPETLEYTFHDDQSHSHECSREPSHEHTHVNDHEHNHTHDHGHGHEHDHEHNHVHDHERHEHDHEHSTHDENYRLVPAVYENDNNGESEYSDYSQFTSDGYLQENQLIVMNKAYVEDMKVKLDSVLYKLHEKDVQNNELTRELIELLKERDILQLKLSSAYRLLANQEKEETDSDQTSDSLKNTELISKINELDSLSGWHDAMMKSESEQKNMQALYSNQALPRNLKTQNSNPIESDSESAIYSLYNWITGSR